MVGFLFKIYREVDEMKIETKYMSKGVKEGFKNIKNDMNYIKNDINLIKKKLKIWNSVIKKDGEEKRDLREKRE